MGTGNSKEGKLENDDKYINTETNDHQALYTRQKSIDELKMEMQPLKRNRKNTFIPDIQNLMKKDGFDLNNEQKLSSKKFTESYCHQFKNYYMSQKNNNTILKYLINSLQQKEELTKEQIEIIRNQYMPKYILDWRLEKDSKTGLNYWKNYGKIDINENLMKEIKELFGKTINNTEPFYKKRAWLIHFLSENLGKIETNPTLVIDRNNILETSYQQFTTIKELNLKLPIRIYYVDEKAHDEGGVNRDWYSCLFRDIFSKEKKLFRENPNECITRGTFLIHPKYPGMNMDYYKFTGKLFLKAFLDNINLKGVQLNNVLIMAIMKKDIQLEDLKYYDLSLYKSLKEIKDSNIKENKSFSEFKFVWNIRDEDNQLKEVELIPNGKNISLNEENKELFINKVIYQEIIAPYEEQINNLREGCYELIGKDISGIFNIEEVKFLLSGQNILDINDWMENTEYKGKFDKNHKVIKMFWEKMKNLSQTELSKFLEFCTGVSNAPIDGFCSLKGVGGKIYKFTIEPYITNSSDNSKNYEFRLIEAKTCFNRIMLPEYRDKEEMDKAFDIILSNDTNFFGLE